MGKCIICNQPKFADNAKVCSPKCAGKWASIWRIGEGNPNWKGGKKPLLHRRLERRPWIKISKFVRARDNFTCQKCKKTNCKLNVHHLIPYRETQNDNPENLVTLCVPCHKKVEITLNQRVI